MYPALIRGGDLPGYRMGPPVKSPATPKQCCVACLKSPECKGWVLVKDGGVCWLKGSWAAQPESDDCCVGVDMRPGGEVFMREAAGRTAELAQRQREAASGGGGGGGGWFGSGSGGNGDHRFGGSGGTRVAGGGSAAAAEELRRQRADAAAHSASGGAAGGAVGGAGARGGVGNVGGNDDAPAASSVPAPWLPGMSDRVGGSLLILLPTVPRRGVDYLTPTVDSLLGEARGGKHGFDRVAIRVVERCRLTPG